MIAVPPSDRGIRFSCWGVLLLGHTPLGLLARRVRQLDYLVAVNAAGPVAAAAGLHAHGPEAAPQHLWAPLGIAHCAEVPRQLLEFFVLVATITERELPQALAADNLGVVGTLAIFIVAFAGALPAAHI